MTSLVPSITLPEALRKDLEELFVQGTPANTLRAYERDLAYISAWKQARFGAGLDWPEQTDIALTFVLDHARDLSTAEDPARAAAQALIDAGLRRRLAAPAPATLDRRIASWRALHGLRNLASPFEAPILREARRKARRAQRHRPARKSQSPITREVLEAMLATCGHDLRSVRDRAVLMLAWASGGRRRSEVAGLMREDIDLTDYAERGVIWLTLIDTKTTAAETTPRLILKGRAARALVRWIVDGGIADGPLFRAVSKADRALGRGLSADGVGLIVKNRLEAAGYERSFASAHGLRAGFLTQAALDGAPIQAAMRLSLHRSVAQAMSYYDDVELADNPAADLLEAPEQD